MHQWDSVAIIGVGLIGGSIGLALRRRKLARHVVGIGRSSASLRAAKRREAVDSTTTDLKRGVASAELVVVCTPVANVVDHVRAAAESANGAIITDAASTKAEIVTTLDHTLDRGVSFVGSHPMAGSERTGVTSSQDDLFQNRVVVVTPTRRTKPAALAAVEQFWQSLGANVTRMSPQAHDEAVAEISHLPHVVASALASAAAAKHLPLAASGWQDTTRIAAADPQLWQQILSENRGHVLKSLDKFEKVLASFRRAIEQNDARRIIRQLEQGKQNRDAVGS